MNGKAMNIKTGKSSAKDSQAAGQPRTIIKALDLSSSKPPRGTGRLQAPKNLNRKSGPPQSGWKNLLQSLPWKKKNNRYQKKPFPLQRISRNRMKRLRAKKNPSPNEQPKPVNEPGKRANCKPSGKILMWKRPSFIQKSSKENTSKLWPLIDIHFD